MSLQLTEAYQKICQILVDNESIVSREELKTHLDGLMDFPYTNDDMCLAYDWACQAIKRIIIHNYGKEALAARAIDGIHKYHIMTNGEVCHEDEIYKYNEDVYSLISYNVYKGYLPQELKDEKDDTKLKSLIYSYWRDFTVKPIWIV